MKAIISNLLLPKLKPKDKPYDVRDEKLTGFFIRVNVSGKLVYMCEYGRGKRMMLGNVGVLTAQQARDMAKDILADAVKGIDPRAKKKAHEAHTFCSFLEKEYAPWYEVHTKGGKQNIDRIKLHFIEILGHKKLTEIDAHTIEKWCTNRLNKGIKPSTINRDLAALKTVFAKALEWKQVHTHPLTNLKKLKVDHFSKTRYLSKDEEARLRKTLNDREAKLKKSRQSANQWRQNRGYELLSGPSEIEFADHLKPMIILSLNTGMRRGELFSLYWENINFATATLSLPGNTTKSSLTRHIPLNSEVLNVLKIWQKQTSETGLIFKAKDHNKFDNVNKSWKNILKSAQIENFRWHDMRHHFASRLVMAAVDLNTVRELLGHSDIKMTLRYAHLAPEHKALAVEKLVSV